MIDIIVPTYNRPKDIEKFVHEIQKQTYEDFHVIIVDDCSVETIENLIPPNHTKFTYVKLQENKGQAYARNVALEIGKGGIIVSLDDDAWFENADALSLIKEYFDLYQKLGCLMFDVRTPQDAFLSEIHSINEDAKKIGSHITCGCAYTRDALNSIGGFGGYLHSGAEETDVTLRLIAKGFELRFAKQIKVFHNYLPGIRSKKWYRKLRFNTTRNDLMIVMMRYPTIYIIPYLFGKYFSHVFYSYKNNRDSFIVGFYTLIALPAAILKMPIIFRNRLALNVTEFKNWIKIRW